ncbi:MAG TPA: hypothetical protein VG713_21205, partial [Pirellulales bacterium]|nr:hypothetical protein [Pirellulales bacterium]
AASPDLLAYLAFLNEQERIRADAHERWTIEDRRAAIERYRRDVDRQAWQAGMAKYEAEHLRRRADFSIAESKIRNEADVRIRNVQAELDELFRAAEEDARQRAKNELVAKIEAFLAKWNDASTTMMAAMEFQAADDQTNVERSRNMVRVIYAPDPAREARWIRASAWSAAEREVRERTTKVRMARDREASEAAFKSEAARQARAKLHGQLAELRRRDAAVIAGMRREYQVGYQDRQRAFDAVERSLKAEAVAEIEQVTLRRAERWAAYDAGRPATDKNGSLSLVGLPGNAL